MVTVGEFQKFDLRIGTIVAAEPIPGSDRLLRIQVDVGAERRQVVAGVAAMYQPQELQGLQVVVLANLAAGAKTAEVRHARVRSVRAAPATFQHLGPLRRSLPENSRETGGILQVAPSGFRLAQSFAKRNYRLARHLVG